MRFSTVQRVLGLLLMIFSTTMIPPILVSLWYNDNDLLPFIFGFALTLTVGIAMWFPVRNARDQMRIRDGFLIVVLFWVVLGMSGGVPFILSEELQMSFTDATFESISGMTTTGATTLTEIDGLPESILYYRQQLHWFGGMGIIVLAVAILPLLGIGGMQLFRAETPGPMKDAKLTPRIRETAKSLWYIYLGITIACALAYWMAGMTLFDAIGHSFATVATGGFSTHTDSIAYFNSSTIEWISIVFMVLAGANFSLHYLSLRNRSLLPYLRDPEFKVYFLAPLIISALIAFVLLLTQTYSGVHDAIRDALFHVVSIGTTTGFATAPFAEWPTFIPVLIIFVGFVAGSSGSTAGGIKTIRVLLLYKQGWREILRIIHPNAKILVKLGDNAVNERVIDSVWGFFAIYCILFVLMMLMLMATDLDLETSFSAVAACINNVGPGLGEVTSSVASLNDFSKWVLTFAMLLGRLEIFTLLVLLTPAFWKR